MPEDDEDGFEKCAGCGGSFVDCDLVDGEYCQDCFDDLVDMDED